MSSDSDETTRIQQEEVDANYVKFKERLPELLKSDENRFALMHNGEIVACFDTARDASEAGKCIFKNKALMYLIVVFSKSCLSFVSYQ